MSEPPAGSKQEDSELVQTLHFLLRASEVLASSHDLGSTLQQLAELLVSHLADGCGVFLEIGGELQLVANAHKDRRKDALIRRMVKEFPLPDDVPHTYGHVFRTGRSSILSEVLPEHDDSISQEPARVEVLKELNIGSAMAVPLWVGGNVIGVLGLFNARGGRRYGPGDLAVAEDFARRAAVAIDNVRQAERRRDAERKLIASEERLQSALEAADVGTWSVDLDTGMDTRDASLNRILGLPPFESTQPMGDFTSRIHPDDRARIQQTLDAAISEGRVYDQDCRIVQPDGSVRWVRDRGQLMQTRDGRRYLMGAVADITGRKRAEQELLESREREHQARLDAEELVRARTQELAAAQQKLIQSEKLAMAGQLAAGVGHEINNPLSFVIANLGFIEGNLDKLRQRHTDPELADSSQCLRDAQEGARRIRNIVRDLKTFSRSDEMSSESVDVREPLEFALTMAMSQIRHRARIDKQLGPVPQVNGNPSKLSQVFLNLLINAAQAMPEGNVAQNRLTLRSGQSENGFAWVEVRDTGTGISPEVLPHIFEPFFSTKPYGQGTGLGLGICHEIIRAHGGELEVETELGKGTCFRVLLPPAIESQPVGPPPNSDAPQTPRPSRLLVADDEPAMCKLLARLLAPSVEVVAVQAGREVLERLARGERYDLILCDLMMPDVTGMDVHAVIRERYPELLDRLAFMTGGGYTARSREFLETTSAPVLQKPFDAELIRSLIESRRRTQS